MCRKSGGAPTERLLIYKWPFHLWKGDRVSFFLSFFLVARSLLPSCLVSKWFPLGFVGFGIFFFVAGLVFRLGGFSFFFEGAVPSAACFAFRIEFQWRTLPSFFCIFFYRVYRFWPTDAAAVVVNDVSLKELVECFSNISLDLRRRQFLFGYRADFTVFAAQDFKERGLVFDQLMGLADEIGFKRIVFNLSTEYRNKLPRLGHCQGAFLGWDERTNPPRNTWFDYNNEIIVQDRWISFLFSLFFHVDTLRKKKENIKETHRLTHPIFGRVSFH